jgi:deaminated glutathione amidase
MCSGIDPRANADTLASAIAEAKAGGAIMLFTPEMSGLLDRDRARVADKIMTEESDITLSSVRTAAKDAGLWVAIGSLAVRASNDTKWRNRSFLIDANGDIRARYDKLHMFDVDLPGGESWRESNAYQAGDSAIVAETPVGALGLSICYDLRFPTLYTALSEAGATILSIPAAFTVPTGKAHWQTLLKARAVENACYVVAAAQIGLHDDGRQTYGHSLVIDPWGEVLLDMDDDVGVGFADIDSQDVAEARSRIPVISHRRPIPHVERV